MNEPEAVHRLQTPSNVSDNLQDVPLPFQCPVTAIVLGYADVLFESQVKKLHIKKVKWCAGKPAMSKDLHNVFVRAIAQHIYRPDNFLQAGGRQWSRGTDYLSHKYL